MTTVPIATRRPDVGACGSRNEQLAPDTRVGSWPGPGAGRGSGAEPDSVPAREIDTAAADPNGTLRDAMVTLGRALTLPTQVDTADGPALRDRVDLLERLVGMTTAGLAATLAALRKVGAIEADGAASTAAWVKANTSRSGRDAARAGRLADNLDELPATAEALASGQLTAEAADAVVTAARDGRIGDPARVEEELLPLATSGPPEELRADIRRRHQELDAAAMVRDERHQHANRRFQLGRRDSGMWDVHGTLPDEVGQQFATALEAFDHPEPQGTPTLQRRRPEQRRADALAALVGVALDRGLAPGTGGIVRPHLSVIVPAPTVSADLGSMAGQSRESTHKHPGPNQSGADQSGPDQSGADQSGPNNAAPNEFRSHQSGTHHSKSGGSSCTDSESDGQGHTGPPAIDDPRWAALPPGDLDWGGRLSPQAVRRLCCDADVTRIIMTADSQVLDVGRATRVWSQPQRRAVNARDRHCRGPGCTRPIGWTQIHHIRWWERDRGPTDLDNGIALCTHCHHLVHDRGWTVELDPTTSAATWTSPSGRVTVTRPPGHAVQEWRPPRAESAASSITPTRSDQPACG